MADASQAFGSGVKYFCDLLAIEMRNRLANLFRVNLPSTLAFDHPTVTAVAGYLYRAASGNAPQPAPAAAEAGWNVGGTADVAAMSDDEAEAELLRELKLSSGVRAR